MYYRLQGEGMFLTMTHEPWHQNQLTLWIESEDVRDWVQIVWWEFGLMCCSGYSDWRRRKLGYLKGHNDVIFRNLWVSFKCFCYFYSDVELEAPFCASSSNWGFSLKLIHLNYMCLFWVNCTLLRRLQKIVYVLNNLVMCQSALMTIWLQVKILCITVIFRA